MAKAPATPAVPASIPLQDIPPGLFTVDQANVLNDRLRSLSEARSTTIVAPAAPVVAAAPAPIVRPTAPDVILDVGDWINGKIAAAIGAGQAAAFVTLPAGGRYAFKTTIVIPSGLYVDLDGQGSELTYTGTGIAIQVNPAPQGAGVYITGRIHDLYLIGNAGAGVVGIHHESRIGMIYQDIRVWRFNGVGGAGIWFENKGELAGLPNFCEQNTIRKADLGDNTAAIKVTVSAGGTNSFAYNTLEDVHLDIRDGQSGVVFLGTGPAQSLFINGGLYNLRINCQSPTLACKCFYLASGADWERSTVIVNGEQTTGAVVSTGLFVDSSSIFDNFGFFEVDGTTDSLAGTAILQPNGFHNSVAPFTTYTTDVTGLARFQKDVTLGVPGFDVHIKTDHANADTSFILVIPAGATSASHVFSRMFNSVPNVTIATNTPITKMVTAPITLTGIPVTVTVTTVDTMAIAGNVTSFNADVSNVLTPLTPPFTGSGSGTGAGTGAGFANGTGTATFAVPDYPTLSISVAGVTASIATAQGGAVTLFCICHGNPN